jgi:serine protease inhibitor
MRRKRAASAPALASSFSRGSGTPEADMRRRDFIAGSGALLLSGAPRFSLAESADDRGGLMSAQARLTQHLVGHLQKSRGAGDNVVISPASLTAILAALALGADDKMQAAIHQTLKLDEKPGGAAADLETIRSRLRNIGLQREEQGAVFALANMIVIDPRARPNASVVERLRGSAEVVIDDLSKGATVERVNAWAAEQTRGLIRKVFEGPQRQAGLAGVNALYFKGLWQERFDAKLTQPQPFRLVGGGSANVPMMTRVGSYRYRENGRFVAVDLPYRNDRFALTVATTSDRPAPASELAAVAGWLDGEAFAPGRVDLSLPRFTVTGGAELLEALDAVGLKAGRTSPTAFAPLSATPQLLDRIVQQTYLRVDEEGTEAAATTGITTTRTARPMPPFKVVVDKPFIFALRDRRSGLLLMSGYIGNVTGNNTVAER